MSTLNDSTGNARPIVEVHNLHKRFGDLEVLRGINLNVRRGEVVCILGPSGSGKTTFLRCINHLETIDAGSIRVDGHLVGYEERADGHLIQTSERKTARRRRSIGMVFQQFNLFWHMTLLQNIVEAPIRVKRISPADAEDAARVLLDRVGLSDKVDVYPRNLSGGQQQRGAIARALAMEPTVMLFDEPTSALDPETIGEVLGVMSELADGGMTMLVVTHELGFAREAANRLVMMDDGVIVEDGPTEEVFANPQHERTRRFLRTIGRE